MGWGEVTLAWDCGIWEPWARTVFSEGLKDKVGPGARIRTELVAQEWAEKIVYIVKTPCPKELNWACVCVYITPVPKPAQGSTLATGATAISAMQDIQLIQGVLSQVNLAERDLSSCWLHNELLPGHCAKSRNGCKLEKMNDHTNACLNQKMSV